MTFLWIFDLAENHCTDDFELIFVDILISGSAGQRKSKKISTCQIKQDLH